MINHVKKIKISLAVSLVLAVSACGENKTAAEYLADSKQLIQQENYTQAVIQLKNAIKLSPKEGSSRALLADVYLKQGNYNAAEQNYTKAIDLGVDKKNVIQLLVKAYSKLNDFDKVYQLAEEAENLSDDKYLAIITFAGISATKQGDKLKAEDYLRQAAALNKQSSYSLLAKAYLSYITGEYDESQAIVSDILQQQSNFTEATLLQGYIKSSQADYQGASEAFEQYLAAHPEANYVKLLEINSLISARALEEAETKVDRLLARYKQATLAKQFKAQIAFLNKDFATAAEFSNQAIYAGLDYNTTRLIAGISAYKQKSYELAYQHLVIIADDYKADSEFKRLFTFVQLKLGHESEALTSLEDFDELSVLDGNLFAETGMQLARTGKIEQAKSLLSKANKLDKSNSVNLLREGMLKLQSADSSGINEIIKAIELDEDLSQNWFTVALVHVRNKEIDKALSAADKWQETSPADALALKGIIYIRAKQYKNAVFELNNALAINTEHMGAKLNLIRAYVGLNQLDKAIAGTKSLLLASPQRFEIVNNYIQLSYSEGQLAKAKVFIAEQMQLHPNEAPLYQGMAMIYRLNKKPEEAVKLLESKKANLTTNGWEMLGDSYMQARDLEQALVTFNQWKNIQPNTLRAWLRVIEVLDLLNRSKKAYDTVLSANKLFPENTSVLVLKANYEIKQNKLTEANYTLNTLKKLEVEKPIVGRLIGELALKEKNYDKAEYLLAGYYKHAPSVEVAEQYANALVQNKKLVQANELMVDAFNKYKKTYQDLFIVAQFFSSTKQPEKAVSYYEVALRSKPDNLIALNNLAMLKGEMGDNAKAIIYAKKAYELAPNHPGVIDTLGWLEYNAGEREKGVNLIKRAYQLAPNAIEIKSHYDEVKNK